MSRKKFLIEETSPHDPRYSMKLEELTSLFNGVFGEMSISQTELFAQGEIENELDKYKPSGVLIAREKGSGLVVGSTLWFQSPAYNNQAFYWLQGVRKEYRKNRIGNMLDQRLNRDLVKRGYEELYGLIFTAFKNILRIRIKQGWKRVQLFDKGEFTWGPYNRAVLMKKALLVSRRNGYLRLDQLAGNLNLEPCSLQPVLGNV